MKTFHYDEYSLKLFGVPFFEESKRLERLPEKLRKKIPTLSELGRRIPGSRLCFRTDSSKIIIHINYEKLSLDLGMSIYQGESAAVFIGDRQNSFYAGLVHPNSYDDLTEIGEFAKSDKMEDVTIFLPRNPVITSVSVEVEETAVVLPPTPYRYAKPIVYYGSSITEGASGLISNSYNALISRWLDVDYYNLGFSGNARGEKEIAEYIHSIDKSIFVYDYDYNAPTSEYLKNTHESFFRVIREKEPNLPIVILSRPNFTPYVKKDVVNRSIIKKTYENALAEGDKNVYFIDGETLFGDEDRTLCTLDTIHPNDLGFYRMAKRIYPVIKGILEANASERW